MLGVPRAESASDWPMREAIGSKRDRSGDTHIELEFRSQALQLGFWLGWLSIIALFGGPDRNTAGCCSS